VFVSGGGSNFKAIHAAILEGHINADVVVSQGCRVMARAPFLTCLFNSAAAVLSLTAVALLHST
jgi:folate-dependent phosphoribosylglycinamide formyltransferase PurN